MWCGGNKLNANGTGDRIEYNILYRRTTDKLESNKQVQVNFIFHEHDDLFIFVENPVSFLLSVGTRNTHAHAHQ